MIGDSPREDNGHHELTPSNKEQTNVTTETRATLPQPQDPVREPIINSPYDTPQWRWQLDTSTKAYAPALPGRRESQNIPPVAGSRKLRGIQALPGEMGVRWIPIRLVNDIRKAVIDWQQAGYQDITQTSRDLVNHWTDQEACQPYFAQLDAMLTHIYLNEAASEKIKRDIQEINTQYNDGILRIAHKMATATGKTPVMAMIILYHTANHRNAAPDDNRFTRRFLVITPGLTVRERLQDSLDPGHDDSDWKAFSLVPPGDQWEQALSSASVNVINYHQMQSKDTELTSTRQQQLIDGGANPTTPEEILARKETPKDVIDRIADGKSQQGPILVINDEGHHCHRGDPDKRNAMPQNTQWFEGIRQIRETGFLQYVVDMSATPIFLAQSNPRPFDWIVSDYSLIDAIEAGLTKIPRVPTSTNRSDDSKLRDIFSNTDSKQAGDFRPDLTGNNPLLKEALNSLYRDYEDTVEEWRDLGRTEPPVMAIVMNSVKNANAMFRHIASGAVTPLLSNYEGQLRDEIRNDPRTIIVHSKMEDGEAATGETGRYIRELADVFRRNAKYGFSDSDKSEEIIRRVMNTVGRHGLPGENVRCVISVNMLTEGWNTKTVTHLLGFRKFGSSLLCEQVAGRTLRRVTKTKEDDEIRFEPEYAQILGIPFPQYAEPDPDPNGKEKIRFPPVTVEPDPDRRHLRVEWPNVVQLRRTGSNRPIEVQTKPEGPDETHEVPAHISERINVEPTAGETARFQGDPPVTAKKFSYLVAATVVRTIEDETEEQVRGGEDTPIIQLARLFSQTVNATEEYRQKGYLTGPDNQDRWASDEMAVLRASEWLHRNVQVIKPGRSGVQMEAEGSAIAPWLHTGLIRSYDVGNNPDRVYGPTQKSEITYADCDSSWEVGLAQHLDEMPEIDRWARNKGLNWSIPYVVDRQQKRYWPDFVAVTPLREGLELNIVIETKGLVREYDPIKRRWAQEYWVPAVNRHAEYGTAAGKLWAYLYLDSEALVIQAQDRIRELIENVNKE